MAIDNSFFIQKNSIRLQLVSTNSNYQCYIALDNIILLLIIGQCQLRF